MVETKHVAGKDKGEILIYTLSTCIWCKKTKALLKEMGIAYDYIDVDMLDEKEADAIEKEISKWNPKGSFPTLVLKGRKCIVGYDEAALQKELS